VAHIEPRANTVAAAIHQARQNKADLETAIHSLKTEGRALACATTRTAAQVDRLDAIDAAIDAKHVELGAALREIARLEKFQQDEIGQATGGTDTAVLERPRGRKFAEMFPRAPLSLGGFSSSEEFLGILHSGLYDSRLVATSTEGTSSEGGFSVPNQIASRWLDSSLESEIVRSRADVFPMSSNEGDAPGWDDGTHTSNLYGGFAGEWVAEGGDISVQTPKLRLIDLKARKLALLGRVSNELLADGMGFESQYGAAITKALGWFMDLAFFSGNGASAPRGILNASCLITVAKETNQVAATINYFNLAKMFARLTPGSLEKSVWVANTNTIPQLLTLGMPVGTGGSHVPVLSESGGKFTMLTRPVIFTEKVPALGTVGDIGLFDFSQYAVGMRQEFSLAKSAHVGFASDTTYVRGIIRVDGQPKLSAPITPKYGETLSPFVVLATRA
jgi:HK97 family phage major capsid protein